MAQEGVAEADVFVRALDEARHVAHGEPMPIRIFHNADLRCQRGEWIRGNLRSSFGNGREQRRFAGVRIADQAHVRDDAQFQQKFAFFAGFARLREARRLSRGGGKVAVAQSTAAAFSKDKLLAVVGQISNQLALFV